MSENIPKITQDEIEDEAERIKNDAERDAQIKADKPPHHD